MKARRNVIVASCVAVLLFDLVASLAARQFEFPYVRASVGSYFLYLLFGFLAGRNGRGHRAQAGATAAAVAGMVDVSLGWAISWAIGPGRPPSGTLSPIAWMITAAVVVLFAAAIGYIGGVLGARSQPLAHLNGQGHR
jgi:hypothetical protein